MSACNLLIIMDDEHSANALGCYGHPFVKTPNLDRLAAKGTRFSSAYTNSPICVPARAAFQTGDYPHRTRYWDNCMGYDGKVRGWGHVLQQAGRETTSIGKLHYLENCSNGFDHEYLPMYLKNFGDTHGLVRDDPPTRPQSRTMAEDIGPGETQYIHYDRSIREKACDWLREKADQPQGQPWTTFVSFICPHYPLIAPQEFFDLYDPKKMPLPKKRPNDGTADSAWWRAFENCYIWDQFFESDEQRQIAIASYYALVSFIDHQVGQILDTLEETGLDKTTRIVFLSDHGENLGARGLWAKSVMYDESVAVPMILSGPGIPAGRVCDTPVSIIDIHPTVLDCAGIQPDPQKPGRSLIEIANLPDDDARPVFSEYHATAAQTGEFMIRRGRYKFIHYVNYRPELYDVRADPEELVNLALNPAYAGVLTEFNRQLRDIVDPDEVDRRAKADQSVLIEKLGGRDKVARTLSPAATPAPTA